MAKNCNVVLIRHAEKPASGTGLAVAGQERAQAYTIYFQNYMVNGTVFKPDFIFCSTDSSNSDRPYLTIEPLAKILGLTIDDKHADKDYKKVADDILQNSKYDNKSVLICWHHGEILALAADLGAGATTLPASSNWPAKWPGDVFGWLLQVCFDGSGNIVTADTFCISEQLMYDDYGQVPPAG
jgi:hypothetical protein